MSTTTTAVRITIATLVVAGGVLALVNAGASSDRSSGPATEAPVVAVAAQQQHHAGQAQRGHESVVGFDNERGSGSADQVAEIYIEGHDPTDGRPVSANQNWETYLYSFLVDVDAYWTQEFEAWGYTNLPAVKYSFPAAGEELVTECSTPIDATTMQYCPTDDTLTIHQDAAYALSQGLSTNGLQNSTAAGDMGVAVVVAHEYGHNLWFELGLFDYSTDAQKERGADCLAGVWTADAANRGLLEAGDMEEAGAALDLLAEHPDLGVSDNGVHGTAAERQQAFTIGYQQGAAACVQSYSSYSA